MPDSVPDVVERYIALLNRRDSESLLALFMPDAVVVDEGQTRRGATEIRTCEDVALRFQYTAGVLGVEVSADGEYVARVRLEGDFPGGVVELNVRIEVEGEGIRRLENTG
jgi:uncharacterized protein (TIGR02246 family)